MTNKDRIEIHIHRAGAQIVMSAELPEVAYKTKGILSDMGWLEPAVNQLLWSVCHSMNPKEETEEKPNG
jgi:hypothetical protein